MPRTATAASFAVSLAIRGEAVTYAPHDGDAVPLRAVRGVTAFREGANRNYGGRITRTADFLFDPVAFRTAVGRWPDDGDRIVAATPVPLDGLTATTYRVTPTNGEPVYRLDPTYTILRVHSTAADESTD